MTTPTATPSETARPISVGKRVPLRVLMHHAGDKSGIDGVWRPQSRNLQVEAADLVDHLPADVGYINRLLFSRPDWDDALEPGGGGSRRVMTGRGWVKMGSFPSDDTQLMIMSMASGQRLRLAVLHSDSEASSPTEDGPSRAGEQGSRT